MKKSSERERKGGGRKSEEELGRRSSCSFQTEVLQEKVLENPP